MHEARRWKTVLVIEDNPGMRGLIETTLAGSGYAVLPAQTAQEGLTLASEQTVDAILLDLALPDRSGAGGARRAQGE